ncbi:MAG: glycerophosphodiester phosphodiesterase [Bacillus sp. (in: firmicutes)]
MGTTEIYAHRGSAGTHPENTMAAFLEAERVGADGIELDVQLTKDNEIIVIHDEKVDRTTNGKGYVKDYTLRELKTLDASYKFPQFKQSIVIPTLEEVFDFLLTNSLMLNIELKNSILPYPGLEEKVIALINQYKLQERIILSSFNHYSLVHCYRLAPNIEISPLYRDGLYMPWVYAKAIHATGIHPNINVAPKEIIIAAMSAGIAVRPYTINNEAQMLSLYAINCSAFITDYPEKAIRLKFKESRK